MTLFWENGYEGTTFDDLIGKMSISPSSFYNAFGSKEQLYREATECFVADARAWIMGALWKEGVHPHRRRGPSLESRDRVHA